jgi:ApaG protein
MIDEQGRARSSGSIYRQTTKQVRISVEPDYLLENSDPAGDIYAFSYNITIENLSTTSVQLLERHWIILSAGVQIAEVVGPGVVGVQPTLAPGEKFNYSSGAVIHDPIGSMHGSYLFRAQSNEHFEVAIPCFDLVYPIVLH